MPDLLAWLVAAAVVAFIVALAVWGGASGRYVAISLAAVALIGMATEAYLSRSPEVKKAHSE